MNQAKPVRVLCLRSVDGAGGGAESIILRMANRLNPDNVRMSVCCIHSPEDRAFDFDRRSAALGIDYHGVSQRSIFARGVLRAVRRVVRDRNIGIVDAQDYKASFLAMLLARLDGVVPMATLHGWSGNSIRERTVYYPAEKMIVRRFPLAIAVSSQIRDTLARWGGRRDSIRVVPNGIDPDEFRRDETLVKNARDSLGVQPEDVVVGSVGRLDPMKRFDVLLEAMKRLLPRRPRLRLFIAGEGSLRRNLNTKIRQLGIAGRCRLLGHRADMRDVYHAFDVFVQSSDSEGTPTVVVEAMAMQIPVVATDVGGTSELVQDGVHGLLVPPRNPAALAQAIEKTLDDRDATAGRVTAARARIEGELSFDARTQKLENIYLELAGHNGRHHDSSF